MALDAGQRKSVLRVLFISLLLDLVRTALALLPMFAHLPLDIVYVHPSSLPVTALFLSHSRYQPDFAAESDFTLPQCVQAILLHTYQFQIRYRPSGRRARLTILTSPSYRIPPNWSRLRQIWAEDGAPLEHGRQHCECDIMVCGNRFSNLLTEPGSRWPQRRERAIGDGHSSRHQR